MTEEKPVKCPARTRPAFDYSPDVEKEITMNAKICPLFEKGLYENAYRRHYSLSRNENLKCAWEEYKRKFESRVFAPFQFPDARDLHFYNGTVRFLPSETIHKKSTFRRTLKPGPGVDYGGQMPIPQELMMKRLASHKEKEEKKGKKKASMGEKGKDKNVKAEGKKKKNKNAK